MSKISFFEEIKKRFHSRLIITDFFESTINSLFSALEDTLRTEILTGLFFYGRADFSDRINYYKDLFSESGLSVYLLSGRFGEGNFKGIAEPIEIPVNYYELDEKLFLICDSRFPYLVITRKSEKEDFFSYTGFEKCPILISDDFQVVNDCMEFILEQLEKTGLTGSQRSDIERKKNKISRGIVKASKAGIRPSPLF
ncbi:MAG: hypothetical protein ACE5QV_07005, partial [Fidelibacterota bacterium]